MQVFVFSLNQGKLTRILVFSVNQGKSTLNGENFTKVSVLNSRWAPLTTLFVRQGKVMKIINLSNFNAEELY